LTVSDEQLNSALQEIAEPQQDPLRSAADGARRAGRRLQAVPRGMRKELTLSTLRQRDVIAHINVTPA
jgi:hypothetical protein